MYPPIKPPIDLAVLHAVSVRRQSLMVKLVFVFLGSHCLRVFGLQRFIAVSCRDTCVFIVDDDENRRSRW